MVRLKDLLRDVSERCGDVIPGMASATGTTTTLIDSRLAAVFKSDSEFNGGTITLNAGTGAMLFSSDCESVLVGDFTSANVVDNDCKIFRDGTYTKTGDWAYKCITGSDAADYAYVSKALDSAYTTLFAQAHFYATTAYTGRADLLLLQTTGSVTLVSVRLTNGALSIYNAIAAETYTPTSTAFSAAAWHRLEMGVVISATIGQVSLWLDDVQIYSGRLLNLGATGAQKVHVGLVETATAEAKTIWFDDVAVDQSYIGDRPVETEKTISGYTASSGTVTWSGTIPAPVLGSRYVITDWAKTRWAKDQKLRTIKQVAETLYPTWFTLITDPETDSGTATITVTRNTFMYALPSRLQYIVDVWLKPSTTTQPYTRVNNWSVDGPAGDMYLRLPNAGSYTTGRSLRIQYVARPASLVDENDALDVDAAYEGWARQYITNMALYNLWMSFSTPGNETLVVADRYRQEALFVQKTHSMRLPPSTLSTETQVETLPYWQRFAPFSRS